MEHNGVYLSREEYGTFRESNFVENICGTWPSVKKSKADELAERYHFLTEEYDKTVCSGVGTDGVLPINTWESRRVSANARKVYSLIMQEALSLGIPRFEMGQAISRWRA